MDFFDLVNISERYLELINPSTPEKILEVGRRLELAEGMRVIEFGSGYGEVLALWAEEFGIRGVGIDIRPHVCERARRKMEERGLADRIEIVCGKGALYEFEPGSFDAAACIGASFVFGGWRETIRGMRPAVPETGGMVIGEPYWRRTEVPAEYALKEKFHHEHDLVRIAREEGYDFSYVVRAGTDDWDTYEAGNWFGLVHWLEENPDHPERQDVIDRLHEVQDEYFRYGREYLGWAMYVLRPASY